MKYWFKNVADNIYIYPKSAPRNLILQTRTSDCNSAYQKRFFKKNIKIQLLTGYFYATTEYLFFLNKENDIYNIVDEGKNIIKKLYDNNQEKFEVYIFYICILQGKRKKWIKKENGIYEKLKNYFQVIRK